MAYDDKQRTAYRLYYLKSLDLNLPEAACFKPMLETGHHQITLMLTSKPSLNTHDLGNYFNYFRLIHLLYTLSGKLPMRDQ